MADCQGFGGQSSSSNAGASTSASSSSASRVNGQCRYRGGIYSTTRLKNGMMPALTRFVPDQPVILVSPENAPMVDELASEEPVCENGCCSDSGAASSTGPAYSVPVAGALVENSSQDQNDFDCQLPELMQGLAISSEIDSHGAPVYVALKLAEYRSMTSRANEVRDLEEQNSALRAEMLVQRQDLERSERATGQLSEALQCSICIETFSAPHTLNCGHTFCKECLIQWLAVGKMCPTCRAPVTQRPSVSYAIQEIVNCIVADRAENPPSSSAVTASGDIADAHADPWVHIFGRQHNNNDNSVNARHERLWRQIEARFSGDNIRCSVCGHYMLSNEQCMYCTTLSRRAERMRQMEDELQSFRDRLRSSGSRAVRLGTGTSVGIDEPLSRLSVNGEEESVENESASTSTVGSDTSNSSVGSPDAPRQSAPTRHETRASLASRSASPTDSNFALNEIFTMESQPRIPAYRLASRTTNRSNTGSMQSYRQNATRLRRQELSFSSRVSATRAYIAAVVSAEQSSTNMIRNASQGAGRSASAASNSSGAASSSRNPIRIRTVMGQGQEPDHSRNTPLSFYSAGLARRQAPTASASTNNARRASRQYSGSSLQLSSLAPRATASTLNDRGGDRESRRACRRDNSNTSDRGSSSSINNNGSSSLSRLRTSHRNRSSDNLSQPLLNATGSSGATRNQYEPEFIDAIRDRPNLWALPTATSYRDAPSNSRETGRLSSPSSLPSRDADSYGPRAERWNPSENGTTNSYLSYD
ncbi:E3 ubiquitin ligase [Coemansia sp. RSA 485]|nr:E3 ubiquitin ligase [Coemansia sp. RSA 485]